MLPEILKKLNRICVKNSSLRILNYYKVKNGKAEYTDLDNWIFTKSDYKDGIYYKFKPDQKEQAISPESEMEEYPVLTLEGEPKKEYVFNIQELNENIILFTAKDDTRDCLMQVYINKKNEAVATNGFYIYIQKISCKKDCIIPVSFIRLCKVFNISEVYTVGKWIYGMQDDIEIYTKITEEIYPNYEVAIPKLEKSEITAEDFRNFSSALIECKNYWNEKTNMIIFHDNWLLVRNEKNKRMKINLNKKIFPTPRGFNGKYFLDIILKTAEGNLYYHPVSNLSMVYFKSENSLTGIMLLRIVEPYDLKDFTEIFVTEKKKSEEKNKPDYKKMYFELLAKYNKEVKK